MTFEDMDVWKRSAKLSAEVFKGTEGLKDYGFRDQLTRSSLSIPSNIAEGFERESKKECIHFLSYAKGSCGELLTQIYIGTKVGYIRKETGRNWNIECKAIGAMLGGLIKTKRGFLKDG